jgi:hypothetical protein
VMPGKGLFPVPQAIFYDEGLEEMGR